MHNRDRPRFFDQVGHQTTSGSIGNMHFTKSWPRQAYQNYEQPCQRSQNSDFQSHFSVSKIGRIFPKKFSVKNIWLGDQLIYTVLICINCAIRRKVGHNCVIYLSWDHLIAQSYDGTIKLRNKERLDNENLALVNNSAMTKKFLIAIVKFDCSTTK